MKPSNIFHNEPTDFYNLRDPAGLVNSQYPHSLNNFILANNTGYIFEYSWFMHLCKWIHGQLEKKSLEFIVVNVGFRRSKALKYMVYWFHMCPQVRLDTLTRAKILTSGGIKLLFNDGKRNEISFTSVAKGWCING
ncbi:hypothetical protein CMI42_01940 [Candidatus Pacearchaeota archaeon]|nr:hypothetical protein [Candidatus Pacearchaeota archaeon]|tara:strand:+ start:578 stop:985 length:408 start_codon:yes stop_codon:yes gene_type:complete